MDTIAQAIRILRQGGLIAFPTETVYGLGADATNPAAVARIFHAKGRPSTNPIIVHVADEQTARRYAAQWPEKAEQLARKFWPGPLTLVVQRSSSLAPQVSAGRETVGLRAPDHPLALELLRQFDGPIAAPSANRSTHVSPTTAQHVLEELGSRVDLILDGGPCKVGIESTVLDLSGNVPMILRPGAVTQEQIAAEIGRVERFTGYVNVSTAAASPGQHAVHYAPRSPAFRFAPEDVKRVNEWLRGRDASTVAMLLLETVIALPQGRVIRLPLDPQAYAHDLYAVLRSVDHPTTSVILVEMPPATAQWTAIRDRLQRATRPFDEFME